MFYSLAVFAQTIASWWERHGMLQCCVGKMLSIKRFMNAVPKKYHLSNVGLCQIKFWGKDRGEDPAEPVRIVVTELL